MEKGADISSSAICRVGEMGEEEMKTYFNKTGCNCILKLMPPEELNNPRCARCLVVAKKKAKQNCTVPLPVQPQDASKVDEQYSLSGYRSIDARAGTDWNQPDE